MDFMSRGNRPNQTGSQTNENTSSNTFSKPASAEPRTNTSNITNPNKGGGSKGARIGGVILLFSITILLVALVASLMFGKPGSGNREFSNVDTEKLQAVFLNGGQVYFGRINSLNPQFMRLNDIYYLRVNQQVQPGQTQPTDSDISLVKLGCELHGPTDSMVVNREQVIFWENLKDDGQVAKAVKEFKDKNPDGQNCDQPQQSGDSTAPAGNGAPATPPATPPADTPPATPPATEETTP